VRMGVPDVFAQSVAFSVGTHVGFYEGTHPTPPRLILENVGSSVNGFTITYETTGGFLEYLGEVNNGDIVEIDFEKRILLVNGFDRRDLVSLFTDAIVFEPREDFVLTVNRPNFTVFSQWRARWV
jgi:hypothetical protein